MNKLGIMLLCLLGLSSLPSCSAISKTEDVLTWVQEKTDKLDQKIEAQKAEQSARIERYEAVVGTFDANGDGSVSSGEAKDVLVNAAQSDDGRKLLLDPAFYGTLAASIAGLYIAKKGTLAGVATLHKTGRSLVGPNQPKA